MRMNYQNLVNLLKNYIAINITSPFKRAYLSQIEMKDVPHDLKAINLIGLNGETFVGTNTDYLALNSLLLNYRGKNKEVVILGDGVMSEVNLSCFNRSTNAF
jgi:shikimate dehydrogenase